MVCEPSVTLDVSVLGMQVVAQETPHCLLPAVLLACLHFIRGIRFRSCETATVCCRDEGFQMCLTPHCVLPAVLLALLVLGWMCAPPGGVFSTLVFWALSALLSGRRCVIWHGSLLSLLVLGAEA